MNVSFFLTVLSSPGSLDLHGEPKEEQPKLYHGRSFKLECAEKEGSCFKVLNNKKL
jgi:hypothetical protein